jgi:hypothetical protein
MSLLPPQDPLPIFIESSPGMNVTVLKAVGDAQASGYRLADRLLSNGFSPVACNEVNGTRKVTVWGILEVSLDRTTDCLQVRKLNETEGYGYRKRHQVWLPHINALRIPEDELLDTYCSWTISRCLQVYGQTAEQAVLGMRGRLREANGQKGVIRMWRRAFYRWLLPEADAKIVRLAYGPDFTISEFNRVVSERAVSMRVLRESPLLLPILGWILTTRESSVRKEIELELFGQEVDTFEFFNGLRRALIARSTSIESERGRELLNNPPVEENLLQLDFGDSETELGERFSPAAWVRLCHLPTAGVRAVFQPRKVGIPKALTSLEYIAATGERSIPLAILKKVCSDPHYHGVSDYFDRRARFLRLLMREAKRSFSENRLLRRLLLADYPAIRDWLDYCGFSEEFPKANSTWASLLRRQETWHRNGGWGSMELPNVAWTSPIEGGVIDGCEYRPLLSTLELQREGEEMHHCVASRWKECSEGRCLIFSLSSSLGRSTVQFVIANGKWVISEHRGACNGAYPDGHNFIAEQIPIGRITLEVQHDATTA